MIASLAGYAVRAAVAELKSRWTTLCSAPPAWFGIFAQLYLCSLLLHYGKRWREPDVTVAVLFLVVWSAARPRRIEPLIIAQVLVLTTTLVDYPRIANHAALQMFVALYLIVMVGAALLRRRSIPFPHIASALRGVAIVVYFYVGFHKLNTGFLDPASSCANWYHAKLFRSAFDYTGSIQDVLPRIVYEWSPWIVVATELLTFVLLLHRRTRLAGLCTAIPLHLYVSLSGFVDFSSMMHSLMFLFLPAVVADSTSVKRVLSGYRVGAVGIAIVSFYMIEQWSSGIGAIRTVQGVAYDLAVIAAVAVIIVTLRQHRSTVVDNAEPVVPVNRGRFMYRMQNGVLPALIFVWGAFPYIGLSSYGSLTMFSNLVTAPAYENHLLVHPDATDLFGLQRDLVQVIDMEQRLARNFRHSPIGELVTRSEIGYQVRRTMRDHDQPLMAFLLENGEPTFYEDLRQSHYAAWPFATRWLFFREIDPVGEAKCRW
ncbi:MAG: hypothetical protein OXC12_17205 [Spirochaetaceae bacterium]|nr:hypothetical protein [Spirochaetaceae bacterium]